MAGVLFIVNIPRREYEEVLRKNEKSAKIAIEKGQYEESAKIFNECKGHIKSSSKTNLESFTRDEENIVITKCKSTDCLHNNGHETGLYKSKSENTLHAGLGCEENDCLKTSWVRQVMKPRRTKLKITNPERGVDILAAFGYNTPLETILSEVIVRLDVKSAAWSSTKDDKFWKVIFSLKSGHQCEELLQVLRTFGVGSRHQSSISVIPCALYYKDSHCQDTQKHIAGLESGEDTAWSRFSSSVRARNNLAQILHDVRAEAALTFDWLFLLLVAAFVAAIGLVENSTVILVASMLISPLMGPITAGTLGTAVRDRSLQQMGVIHELFGLFLSLIIGFIFGLAICAVDEKYGVGDWPTYEMMSRCEIRSLWVGVLVAIPSGAGVALAVLGEYTASLVGVAISASLLPPAVNAGLLWAMALVHLIFKDDDTRWTTVVKTTIYSSNQPTELAVLGAVSLCLTLVNIICIFLAGVAVYKVKEVCPFERRDIHWWRPNKHLCTSTRKRQPDDSATVWDIYSKWCNDVKKQEADKETQHREPTFGLVQNDTVTFRRNHILPQRARAQNIESYCNRNEQIIDGYSTRSTEPAISLNQNSNSDINQDKSISSESDISSKNKDSLENRTFGYFNKGYEDINMNFNKNDLPTIEPSLSLTVDAKNCGIVLNNKAYDV